MAITQYCNGFLRIESSIMFLKSDNEILSSSISFFENKVASLIFHDNIEILHQIKGSMSFSINSKKYLLEEGDFIIVFPFENHKTLEVFGETKFSCIAININKFDGYIRTLRNCTLDNHLITANEVSSRAEVIYSLIESEKGKEDADSFSALTVALLFELISKRELTPKYKLEKSAYERIIEICLENYKDSTFSLEKLSKLIGLSSRTLSRFFKDYLEMSFPEFMSNLRLNAAINLLRGGFNVTQSAINSGFGSVRTFNRAFSKEYNCTPKEYFSLAESGSK